MGEKASILCPRPGPVLERFIALGLRRRLERLPLSLSPSPSPSPSLGGRLLRHGFHFLPCKTNIYGGWGLGDGGTIYRNSVVCVPQ